MNDSTRRASPFFSTTVGYGALAAGALLDLPSLRILPARRVFYKQAYFTGVEAVATVAVIGAMIGAVIIAQVVAVAGANPGLVGRILLWTVVRELGPLFTAIVVVARSGAAVSAELASMKINGEIDWLVLMGVDPDKYLIMPRVAAITLSVLLLSSYFQLAAIMGGLAFSTLFMGLSFGRHFSGVFSAILFRDVIVTLVKSGTFGLIISSVVCYQGLSVKKSITEIPQATIRAVMNSLFLVFVFDGIITYLALL